MKYNESWSHRDVFDIPIHANMDFKTLSWTVESVDISTISCRISSIFDQTSQSQEGPVVPVDHRFFTLVSGHPKQIFHAPPQDDRIPHPNVAESQFSWLGAVELPSRFSQMLCKYRFHKLKGAMVHTCGQLSHTMLCIYQNPQPYKSGHEKLTGFNYVSTCSASKDQRTSLQKMRYKLTINELSE